MSGAAERLRGRLLRASAGRSSVVLIDGRSGSGKTSLADALVARIRASGASAATLPVEHLYRGWEGLAEGAAELPHVLDRGEYRRYDWYSGHFAERVPLPARGTSVLVVEGCGALSSESLAAARRWGRGDARIGDDRPRSSSPLAAFGVWVECPSALRRRRALDRDGEVFRPHWEAWARQEEDLFARARPRSLAREIIHMG